MVFLKIDIHKNNMGLLKNIIDKMKAKKAKESELDEDMKIQHRVIERQKDANERELERYYDDERKKKIAKQLKMFRSKKSYELWHTNAFTNNPNVFRGNTCYLGRYY